MNKNSILKKIYSLYLLCFFSIYQLNAFSVISIYETDQVKINGDADDPAIWINNININNSLVFGTDKYNGIYTYNLKAETLDFSPAGNINNIDIISDDISKTTLLFGSNRNDSSLDLWVLDNNKMNSDIESNTFKLPVKSTLKGYADMIVYGVCSGHHEYFGNIAFITEDEGSRVQLWSYRDNLKLLHTFKNQDATQSEGCVYDSDNSTLFISEEQDRGILRAYKINKNLDLSEQLYSHCVLRNVIVVTRVLLSPGEAQPRIRYLKGTRVSRHEQTEMFSAISGKTEGWAWAKGATVLPSKLHRCCRLFRGLGRPISSRA